MAYVTIKDVAKRAGISVSTVSRALNGKDRISNETKRLVEQVVQELHYIPDSRARAMRSLSTKTVGLLVPDIRNGYFADLAYAVQDALSQAGYCTYIGTSSENVRQQDAFIVDMLSQHIDGAIIVPQGQMSDALRRLLKRQLPVVFVDRSIESVDAETVPLVVSDPIPGMTGALRDMQDLGHRKVGYISGPVLDSPTLQERELVFRQCATKLFGEENIFVESSGFGQSSCELVIQRMLSIGVTALVFGYSPDTVQAISVMDGVDGILNQGMSLVSFDDIELFRLIKPQVSVISQQVQKLGGLGAQIFLDMLRGEKPESQRVETVYMQRGTVQLIG
ncbi:MAG: LacI family DNA-binding transcriptional regulator [Bifidobacterium tsurumiense]|uniref:LacI family DNA-binding transcriptional regulator n=1 Tax=Bifidobacterium tsurumiense TaxID=356829 RepID=UPI002A820B7A|nr:LacI family DNA-binding transcriptional regulator [Bifidobacterium tsurumiense]MDY4677657.1 LacI family DNA-binding transcriptional regulator [Bifidobacterium tsurumiense]